MYKFETTLGNAAFTVTVESEYQNHLNTPINVQHFHIDNEVHVVLDGEAIMEIDGKDTLIRAGEIFFIPQNTCHYYKCSSENFNKICFFFTISKNRYQVKKDFSEYAYYTKTLGSITSYTVLHDDGLVQIGRKIHSLRYSEATEHIYQALYSLFFISLAGLIEKKPSIGGAKAKNGNKIYKESHEQKKIIESFFLTRYGENVTIEDLARALYKSVPQTHRIVKRYFNESFKTVLVKQRIEQACILIKQGESKFCNVALSCGYSSYNGFLVAFKQYTGQTPEEYAKRRSVL